MASRLSGTGRSSRVTATPSGGGGHGLIHNLLADTIDTAKGIVPGMVQFVHHPIGSAELAWAQTKAMYSPLFHGDFGTFYENFHSHPLQPLLDGLSLATLAFGGLGAGIKGTATLADMGRIAEITDAARGAQIARTEQVARMSHPFLIGSKPMAMPAHLDKLIEAGKTLEEHGLTPDLSRMPRLARAAEHFRAGTEHTTRTLPTAVAGYEEVQAYSTNLFRRAMTRGVDSMLEGAAKHGVPVIKEGGALDYTAAGRGNRMLAKTISKRKAATVAAAKLEVRGLHSAIKAGGTATEVGAGLLRRFDHSFVGEAMMVDGQAAQKMARTGELAHFRYIKDAAPRDIQLAGTGVEHVSDFARRLKRRWRLTDDPTKAMKAPDGRLLMIRKSAADTMSNEVEHTAKLLNTIHNAPMRAWKFMVLAQAPRYFVNNVVGNVTMLAAATHPVALTRGVLDAIRSVHGNHAAVRAAKEMGQHVDAEIEKWLPNDFVNAHFGYLQHGALGLDNAIGFNPSLKGRTKSGLKSGLYGITETVAYRATQRVGIMAAARELKQVRDLERLYRSRGVGRHQAFQDAVAKTLEKPAARAAIEKRVTDWAGQYYHLNSLERKITALVPFYNWDRHALRFGKEQVLSRPGRSAALAFIGKQGADSDRNELGPLPSFMAGAVPIPGHLGGVLGFLLGGATDGRKKIILTNGLNPLGAAADDANAVASLFGLGHGSAAEAIGGQLSPFITGAAAGITGTNLVTGAKVHDKGGVVGTIASESFGNLPQANLIKTILNGDPPTVTAKGKPKLYTHDLRSQLASLFGVSLRDYSPEAATIVVKEQTGNKSSKSRARKRRTSS